MIKRMIIMLVAVGLIAAAVFGFEQMRSKGIAANIGAMQKALPTVATVTAKTETWQPVENTIGDLRAINGTDLSLDVAGVVDQISFSSGDDAKAGTPLLRLRGEDDSAKLAQLQASARLAEINFHRDQEQLKAEAISQATLDSDDATMKSAQAQVAQQLALMEKKVLRAPFEGHLGIRQVDIGQYLNSGAMIVTLQQLDPIYIDFHLPEQSLGLSHVGDKLDLAVDAFPGEHFLGQIIAIDPKIDVNSRNVQMRAKLENHSHKLLPGMYGKLAVEQGSAQQLVTLPATAITFNPYGATVYLVDNKGKDGLVVRQTFVTTGASRGDQVAVLKGVKEGDVVVTAGQLKLRNGIPVLVDNKILPTNDAAPVTPDN